ncbi:MAG: ribosomal protein S18-alanine N-acetyltransferase [Gemmatimonadota bacterium]|nr:ribosomal protein S18-alanine N-acetyltransferase [Gemmatimonadota bacterium]
MTVPKGGAVAGVRAATEEDLDRIAEIELEAFADAWSRQSFRALLGDRRVFFRAVEGDDGRVVGYVVAWFVMEDGEIANLAVAKEARGRGVGSQLLEAAVSAGRERGAHAIFLEVRESNETALALYLSHGFDLIGRRRGYYRRPVEDALVLRHRLLAVDPETVHYQTQ